MFDNSFVHSPAFSYLVLPALIFIARICDVTLGTVRILTLSRGWKGITTVLAFFELLIWLLAIGQIFHNLDNWVCYVAYAGGFAMGNFIGMTIEQRLALGSVLLRAITKEPARELVDYLKTHSYGFTCLDAQGSAGPVTILLMVLKRQDLRPVVSLIRRFHPKAFYTVEDVRAVKEGIFPFRQRRSGVFMERLRKGK